MKQIMKDVGVFVFFFLLGSAILAGLGFGTHYGLQYIYRAEIAAAKEQRDLDKYICDKHKGKVYVLTAEDGSKERVCLTSEGIVR